MFLYPQHTQTDFIQSFDEDDMLAIHLAEMWPEEMAGQLVGWDPKGEYKCSDLEVYVEARASERFRSAEEYVDSVENFKALLGRRSSKGADEAEAQLDK